MKNKFIIIFILFTMGYGDVNFNYNGKFSHFFALRNLRFAKYVNTNGLFIIVHKIKPIEI